MRKSGCTIIDFRYLAVGLRQLPPSIPSFGQNNACCLGTPQIPSWVKANIPNKPGVGGSRWGLTQHRKNPNAISR